MYYPQHYQSSSVRFIDKEYVLKLKERLKMTRVGIELRNEGIREGIKKLYEINKEKH